MPSRNKIPIHRNDYRPYYSHCNAHSHWTPMANAFHSSPIHPAISPLASSCCCFLPFLSSSFFDTCTSSKTVLPLLARPYRKLITTSRLKFPHPFTWMQHFITCACHPFSLLCFDWFFFFCIATFSNLQLLRRFDIDAIDGHIPVFLGAVYVCVRMGLVQYSPGVPLIDPAICIVTVMQRKSSASFRRR